MHIINIYRMIHISVYNVEVWLQELLHYYKVETFIVTKTLFS